MIAQVREGGNWTRAAPGKVGEVETEKVYSGRRGHGDVTQHESKR